MYSQLRLQALANAHVALEVEQQENVFLATLGRSTDDSMQRQQQIVHALAYLDEEIQTALVNAPIEMQQFALSMGQNVMQGMEDQLPGDEQ